MQALRIVPFFADRAQKRLPAVSSKAKSKEFALFDKNVLACASQPVYISNQRVSY
jgi:hypothetical protein